VKPTEDLTLCPVCEQLLTDPQVLPCFHAFCSSCLEDWCRERGRVTERGANCPLCNTAFPTESSDTTRNRFVAKLVDLKRILSGGDVPCVLCTSDKFREKADRRGASRQPLSSSAATVYCVDCRQNYCNSCIASHEVINPLVCHRVVERGKPRPIRELLLSSTMLDRCEVHSDKPVDVYCRICRKAICSTCSVEAPHLTHDRVQVDMVFEGLRNAITKDLGGASAAGVACHAVRANLQKIADEFSRHIGQVYQRHCVLLQPFILLTETETLSRKNNCNKHTQKRLKLKLQQKV